MADRVKILASDFDGSLYYNGNISDADLAAIGDFRRAGNKFGIVTGRGTHQIEHLMTLDIDFVICATGAVIVDRNREIIFRSTGTLGEFTVPMAEYAARLGGSPLTYSRSFEHFEIPLDGSAWGEEFEQCNTHFDSSEAARAFAVYVNGNFGEYLTAYVNGSYIDMPPSGNSKVTGIAEYAKGFTDARIFSIGDNCNDIPMIEAFHGIAVSNAVGELKKCAEHQADRVADAIEYIMNEG